jgi:magnesium chelatase subunit I
VAEKPIFSLLPFSRIVGQQELGDLLQVAYVMGTKVGGVLVSGERGTAKSTIVRSFAAMMNDKLPVTLPINATDDRVVGGWDIDALLEGNPKPKLGLLQQAHNGMLYIDEVNLLDDHIINLILDAVSTGVLNNQHEGMDDSTVDISFMLVGTMNPDEGALRPQLLDRFGLFVPVQAEGDPLPRRDILDTVLRFDLERDKERSGHRSEWLEEGRRLDRRRAKEVAEAKDAAPLVHVTDETKELCAHVAAEFDAVGHRAEIVMAQAAGAVAALQQREETLPADVRRIARYALMHRRRGAVYADGGFEWSSRVDDDLLDTVIDRVITAGA